MGYVETPYDLGYTAGCCGRPEGRNPYAVESFDHAQWENGRQYALSMIEQ